MLVESRYHLERRNDQILEPTERIEVVGDKTELQTAFTNLLENAVKYSGNDAAKISVRLKSSEKRADIFIKDNGVGIAPADLKRIFKRFYRVPDISAAAAKGTGLGLSIVRSIIEKHGGRVAAESKGKGKGSTFRVQLPTTK